MALIRRLQRRLATGLNAILVAVLVTVSLGLLVHVAGRHPWRFDLTEAGRVGMASDLQAVLRRVAAEDAEITVTAFSQARSRPEAALEDRALQDLLEDLSFASDRVRTRFVDFDRERRVAEAFGVDRYGTVVVEGGGERVDLAHRELFLGRAAPDATSTGFVGDSAISSAIRRVLDPRTRTIVVLSGHGEARPNERGLGELHALARLIDEQGWALRTVDLLRDAPKGAAPAVPDDAAAVLVLGQRARLAASEREALRRFLARGGSLGWFTEPGAEVPELLADLGVSWGDGVVRDVVSYFPYEDRPLLRYGAHPITEELVAYDLATVVARATAVRADPVVGVTVVPLLETSPQGWSERGGDASAYDEGVDGQGPVTVAWALEADIDGAGRARVLVAGDVDLLRDELLGAAPGNDTFLVNALRWLVHSDEGFTRVGGPTRVRALALGPADLRIIRWLAIGGMPLAMVLLGAIVVGLRRST